MKTHKDTITTLLRSLRRRRTVTEHDFWTRVAKVDDPKYCWEWMGARDERGYGHLVWQRKQWVASRLAWTFTHGTIPPGMVVCHQCDNPSCVRPEHLFVATVAENGYDAISKGRRHAKLFPDRVRAIRECCRGGMRPREVAEALNVHVNTILRVVYGRGWKHVSE